MHRERPFFDGLVKFMTEGPIVVMALEREDAVKELREVMGATNPANAAEGTVRKRFADRYRAQLHPRFGCAGDGRAGAAVLLQRQRTALTGTWPVNHLATGPAARTDITSSCSYPPAKAYKAA